jgi:hypothetical protein
MNIKINRAGKMASRVIGEDAIFQGTEWGTKYQGGQDCVRLFTNSDNSKEIGIHCCWDGDMRPGPIYNKEKKWR